MVPSVLLTEPADFAVVGTGVDVRVVVVRGDAADAPAAAACRGGSSVGARTREEAKWQGKAAAVLSLAA